MNYEKFDETISNIYYMKYLKYKKKYLELKKFMGGMVDETFETSDIIEKKLIEGIRLNKITREDIFRDYRDYTSNINIAKELLKKRPNDLFILPKNIKDSKEIMKLILDINPSLWINFSDRIKTDPEIKSLLDAKIFLNRDYNKKIVNYNPMYLRTLRPQMKDDYDVVKLAVSKEGESLQFASDNLRNNNEIVRIAVLNRGTALNYASDKLKDDESIVTLAINQNPLALQFASDRLKQKLKV